jgi:hypothetical protein
MTPQLQDERETCEALTGGRIRDGIVNAHLQWVRDYHGDLAAERVLLQLPPSLRTEVEALPPGGWCSFESVVALDRAIETLLGRGREGFLRELGRYSADINLSTADRPFRPEGIHAFFRHAAVLHARFQDFGAVRYEQGGDSGGRMVHWDYPCYSRVYCASAIGYYEQSIVIHGLRSVSVRETSCQCAGDAACMFELSWG